MSHISTAELRILDQNAFDTALKAVGGTVTGTNCDVEQYGSNVIPNAAKQVTIPGLSYPVAITAEGEIKFDLFLASSEGRENFNEFRRQYSIHAVTRAAKKRGYRKISAPRVAEDGWTEIDIRTN